MKKKNVYFILILLTVVIFRILYSKINYIKLLFFDYFLNTYFKVMALHFEEFFSDCFKAISK